MELFRTVNILFLCAYYDQQIKMACSEIIREYGDDHDDNSSHHILIRAVGQVAPAMLPLIC